MKSRTNFLKSTKIFRNREKKIENREKYFRFEKTISKSRKMFQIRENYFKIEKNVSESRNILLQYSRKTLELNDFKCDEPLS